MEDPQRQTFEQAAMSWYPALVRRLTLVTGDREEGKDLTQAAYLRAYRAWGSFEGGDVRGWLFTIGLRLALNERRRRTRWRALIGRMPAPSDGFSASDPDLWRALQQVEPRARAALVLTVIDGYSQAEVGRMLEIPPGTVGSLLSRTKARLRVDLGQRGE